MISLFILTKKRPTEHEAELIEDFSEERRKGMPHTMRRNGHTRDAAYHAGKTDGERNRH